VTDQERAAQPSIAIVALTRHGVRLALQIQAKLPESACYVPLRHQFALAMGARGFQRLADTFQDLWDDCRVLICIMATGIVVRHLTPLLRHKAVDPAVVVLDERGQFAISLVSGHLGGANQIARDVAVITGGQAVITTASDVQNQPALDLIAQQAALEVQNPSLLARATRALLEGEEIWVFDPEQLLLPHLAEITGIAWVSREELDAGAMPADRLGIWVSEEPSPSAALCLWLRPRNLVVGVGCNRGTQAEEILSLIQKLFANSALALQAIRNLASIDLKKDEPGLLEAARVLQRPIRFYAPDQLETINVPHPSVKVEYHIGVASVCEAAALLSAADQGEARLLVGKHKTANATVAIARVD
jgi:cobalt-precorrin 5A hydrolase